MVSYPRAINHCHPRVRAREKIHESSVGWKPTEKSTRKRKKGAARLGNGGRGGGGSDGSGRQAGRQTGLSVFRFLHRCRSEREMLHCRARAGSSGVFSRRSTRYTAGICWFVEGDEKRKSREAEAATISPELTLRIARFARRLILYDQRIRYFCQVARPINRERKA